MAWQIFIVAAPVAAATALVVFTQQGSAWYRALAKPPLPTWAATAVWVAVYAALLVAWYRLAPDPSCPLVALFPLFLVLSLLRAFAFFAGRLLALTFGLICALCAAAVLLLAGAILIGDWVSAACLALVVAWAVYSVWYFGWVWSHNPE